jgi:hypothetical protein
MHAREQSRPGGDAFVNSLGMLEDTYLVVCEESSVIVEGVGNSYETRAHKKNDAQYSEIIPPPASCDN